MLDLCLKLAQLAKKAEQYTYTITWNEYIKCGPDYELMSREEYLNGYKDN